MSWKVDPGRTALVIAASAPAWFFDPTAHLSLRSGQWAAVFVLGLSLLTQFRNRETSIPGALWLAPFLIWCVEAPGFAAFTALGAAAAFLVLLTAAGNPALRKILLQGVVLGATLNAVYVVLQSQGLDPLFAVRPEFESAAAQGFGAAARVGFLGNAGDVGLFLAFALLAIPLAVENRRLRQTIFAVLTVAIVLTGSRLALLLAVLYFAWLLPRRWLLLLPLLGIIAVFTPVLRYKTVEALERGLLKRQLKVRGEEVAVAFDAFTAKPVFGHGPGSYGRVEAEIRYETGRVVPESHGWFSFAHNDYAQGLVEFGLAGLALLLAGLILFWRNENPDGERRIAVTLFAIAMLVLYPSHLAPVVWILGLTLGGGVLKNEGGPARRFGWLMPSVAALGLLAGLTVTMGDWLAGSGALRVDAGNLRWFDSSGIRQLTSNARSAAVEARVEDSNPMLQAVLSDQPRPEAALRSAGIDISRGDVAAAVETVCRSYVATGDPRLGLWLKEMQPHVRNLSATNSRLTPCILP